RLLAVQPAYALRQPLHRVVAPRAEHDDGQLRRPVLGCVLLGEPTQAVRDARAKDGTLAHAADAVEQREARGQEVCDDGSALLLAPVEEGGVRLRVGDESDVWGFVAARLGRGPPPASAAT